MVLLLVGFAGPLFVPPAGQPIMPIAPDAPLLARLFPGVPGWWVLGRLTCLAIAALLLMLRVPPAANPLGDARLETVAPGGSVTARRVWLAVVLAALQALAGIWAHRFDRTLQLLYVACLAIPPLILVSGWDRWLRPRRWAWRPAAVVVAIVAVWVAVRVPVAWQSPDAADAADAWVGVRYLTDTTGPDYNLLTDRVMAGGGAYHFIFQGAPLLRFLGVERAARLAQVADLVWFPLCGLLVGGIAGRLFGRAAAMITTAAFLFSPFMLALVVFPLPFFFYALVIGGVVGLFVVVRATQSEAALVALGGVAGIGATLPAANLVSVAVLGAGVWFARQWPRRGGAIVTTGLLFVAAAVTARSELANVPSLASTYSRGRAEWAGHEMAGFGQISAASSEYVVEAAVPRPWDTVLGAVLAPVAVARTPIRKVGDALFDPVGGTLAIVGVAMALRTVRTAWSARLLLGILILGVVPAVVSSQDRISLIRLGITPVPMALLAGVGWVTLQRWLGLRGRAAAVATVAATLAVAAGGTALFDWVTPRVVPASWLSVSLRALGGTGVPGGVLFLDHPQPKKFPYWYLNEITMDLAPRPATVRAFDGPRSVGAWLNRSQPAAALIVWNPALEEDGKVARAICDRWPSAALYTLTDRTRLSRAFVARPSGPGWTPALPATDWSATGCGTPLETEATWAVAVLRDAGALTARGDDAAARDLLRAAARHSFAQAGLFQAAAEAALAAPADHGAATEAVHWAQRACEVTRFADPDALATLAASHAARGDWTAAADAAGRGQAAAAAQGNDESAKRLAAQAESYRAGAATLPR